MKDENACTGAEGALEHLRKAEHDLEEAREEQREANRDVVRAEEEVEEAIREIGHPHQFKVEVIYDGVRKSFEVRQNELVKQLLDLAINAFGPLPQPHTLSLFKDGKELPDNQTIKEAGVKPCDVLLLRPSTVKGGT